MAAFVDTKLLVPRPRHQQVVRPRLLDAVRRAASHASLTLVSAPAGFGKTTLVAAAVQQPAGDEQRSTAWVALDSRDSDPTQFWSCVLRSLEAASPGAAAAALELLDAGHSSLDDVLAHAVNELSVHPGEVVLVLDDYHLVEGPEVSAGMGFLIEHLPPQVQLVISTRADPALPLARLRARGELVEVRASDLRFTAEEATTYLNDVHALDLDAAEVAALETRTEGWVAALQLAALSLHGHSDRTGFITAFAGDDRFVVDYLADEVLDRQPADVRRFLLDTSVLERLHGPLCDAVTGQGGGNARLASLERGNLFIVPLDNRRRWYRYHHLFGDVLQSRLHDERPADVASLHRRASEWFEVAGDLEAAVRHALAADDVDRAADLIEIASPALRRRRGEAVLKRWIKDVPPAVIQRRPVLASSFIGALMSCNEFDGVPRRLRDLEEVLSGPTGDLIVLDRAEWDRLPGVMATHRAGLALVAGDLADASRHAGDALTRAYDGDVLTTAAASAILGLASWAQGDLDTAHRAYAEAADGLGRAGHVADVLGCTVTLVDLEIARGKLHDAGLTVTHALRRAEGHATDDPVRGTADMWVAASRVGWERGDVSRTADHLRHAADLGEAAGLPQQPYRWRVAMARLRAADGDLSGADMLLAEAQRLYTGDFSPDVRPVAATRARIHARAGNLVYPRDWIVEQGLTSTDELTYLREYEHITLARVLIAEHTATGDARPLTSGAALLDRLRTAAQESGRTEALLDVLVLHAITQEALGRHQEALRSLDAAVAVAEPLHWVRPFLDEAPLLRPLVETRPRRSSDPAVLRILRGAGAVAAPSTAVASAPDLVEALSARELDVLRLLGSDLDGPGIARELSVSLNTVRTHTQHVYAKLGVNSRRAAVRRGHQLNL